MRQAEIHRQTSEADIFCKLDLDGTGQRKIDTGIGFFNHMMDLFAKHGQFDLELTCKGDREVDDHHSVEDIGLSLGSAFMKAIGEARGIQRYGHIILPMDEALILVALDISGRGSLFFDVRIPSQKIGDFDTELVKEFFIAFAKRSNISLHIKQISGENSHHIVEGIFKAVARTLSYAVSINQDQADEIPSTKGLIIDGFNRE